MIARRRRMSAAPREGPPDAGRCILDGAAGAEVPPISRLRADRDLLLLAVVPLLGGAHGRQLGLDQVYQVS